MDVEVSLNMTKACEDEQPCVMFTTTDGGTMRTVACAELTIDEAEQIRDQLTALIDCWSNYG